jgi:hypothetical protein
MTGWCIMTWNGWGRKWLQPVWSTTATFASRDREEPTKICQASWCHGYDSHQVLPSEPIPSVDFYNTIHHCYQNKCLIHIPILHASECHHTHCSIYLHNPSSSKVHLCWCKCSVKNQMTGLLLWWRPNITTLVTAILSLLMCLYKICCLHHTI